MDSLDQNLNLSKKELVVTQEARYNFGIAGKWAKFLAIVGFISSGFVVLAGLIMMGTAVSVSFAPAQFFLMGLVYLVMGGILIIPALYLLRYANAIAQGLQSDNQTEFDSAIQNLKSLFKFAGIYTIVLIGIYILVILIAFVAAASGSRF